MIEVTQKLAHTLEQALPRLGYHKREGANESLSECRAGFEGRPCGCRKDTRNVVIISHCKTVTIDAPSHRRSSLSYRIYGVRIQVPDRKWAGKFA